MGAGALGLILSYGRLRTHRKELWNGMKISARQILPAIPILVFISLLSTTWMLGGVVPTFIHYGLQFLNPTFFLVSVCAVSACISVLTGSSWTTIATIGVAFMGIGSVMGYSEPWIAGAVISGAYFGDKVSPLSDTTVVASSSCGVDLFTHIRFLLLTAGPSMGIALAVFLAEGILKEPVESLSSGGGMVETLNATFRITPWALLVPAITVSLIVLRVNTNITLAVSAMLGCGSMMLFQPQFPVDGDYLKSLWSGAVFSTPDEGFNSLVSTSGFLGMLPTIFLVTSAMLFGGVLIGTGMLRSLSRGITSRLTGRKSVIGTTLGSGLLLNGFTADQYLSLIIGANMYKGVFQKMGIDPKVLSRSLEDSISVTSVLIPWNSCGLTQSAVLGVPTLVYFPYCVFNYLSPITSFMMSAGFISAKNALKRRFGKIQAADA
nr:sodium:proton antiporter [uncultured Muribaculaceae bacterium]